MATSARDLRRSGRGPVVAGIELAAGGVRAVVGRREEGRLLLLGNGFSQLPPSAINGGLVVDRAAVSTAITGALGHAEVREHASRIVAAIDGDDIRTFHIGTTFDRAAAAEPIVASEVERALREAREAAARAARDGAAEDPALRGVATVQLREDRAGFAVDGRPLEQLIGFQGRFVEVRSDISLAPLLQAGAATTAIEDAKRKGTVASGIHGLARLLALSGYTDGAVLRLGADLTAFAVIRGGRVVATRVFGLGRDAFLSRAQSRDVDARVWARCVVAPLPSQEAQLPGRWSFVGVPETLVALPHALGDALVEARGGAVDLVPLKISTASRIIADASLHADHLVACGAAALAAELT
ncbi:MAG: hypothetical protein HY071_06550 [Chloroflexi bacterium]|nr:hypothetical protein [Chloroflexota bacterium]